MPIASFGSKTFIVSSSQIRTFDGLKLTAQLRTESKDTSGGKPTVTIKGPGLEELTFNIPLISRFVDVRKEWDDWRAIRDAGVPYLFVLGNKPIITNKFLLMSVDISPSEINGRGEAGKAALALKFTEYAKTAAKKTKSKDKNDVDKILDTTDTRENPNKAASESVGQQMANTRWLLMQQRLNYVETSDTGTGHGTGGGSGGSW